MFERAEIFVVQAVKICVGCSRCGVLRCAVLQVTRCKRGRSPISTGYAVKYLHSEEPGEGEPGGEDLFGYVVMGRGRRGEE